jgi:hypothetical protein
MADIDISGDAPAPAVGGAGATRHQFGLTQGMALIVGSISLSTSLAALFCRATVLGTISTAGVYMLSLTVALGIVPTPPCRQELA